MTHLGEKVTFRLAGEFRLELQLTGKVGFGAVFGRTEALFFVAELVNVPMKSDFCDDYRGYQSADVAEQAHPPVLPPGWLELQTQGGVGASPIDSVERLPGLHQK